MDGSVTGYTAAYPLLVVINLHLACQQKLYNKTITLLTADHVRNETLQGHYYMGGVREGEEVEVEGRVCMEEGVVRGYPSFPTLFTVPVAQGTH